jgi:hypothetical protein
MDLTQIPHLNSEMISIDDAYNVIDFESSEPGIWIPLDSHEDFSLAIKSVIKLAVLASFDWNSSFEQEIVSEVDDEHLTRKFLEIDEMVNTDQVDILADAAIQYLDESAYETDPGWTVYLHPEGLCMESIWTDDSDIWDGDTRVEKIPGPKLSSSSRRKYLEHQS